MVKNPLLVIIIPHVSFDTNIGTSIGQCCAEVELVHCC